MENLEFFRVVQVDNDWRIVVGDSLASFKSFESEEAAFMHIRQFDSWDLVASLIFVACNRLVDERLKMWGHVDKGGKS